MKNRIILVCVVLVSVSGLLGCASSSGSKLGLVSQYESAMVAYKEGRFSDAEPMLRKLLGQYPQFSEGWYRLGNLYVRSGQYDAALTAFKTCLHYDANNTKAWYNLSLVHVKMSVSILDEGISKLQPGSDDYIQLNKLRTAILTTTVNLSKEISKDAGDK